MKTSSTARIPVLIDTDVDIDDWLAILYLSMHPDVRLLGITTTGVGAAHLTPGTRNVLGLLQLTGKPDVPVAAGTSAPLRYSNVFPASIRQPIDAVYNLRLPVNRNGPVAKGAVELLRETLLAAPEPVTILAIGGSTNRRALLRDHPPVPPKIPRAAMSGRAVPRPGDRPPDPDDRLHLHGELLRLPRRRVPRRGPGAGRRARGGRGVGSQLAVGQRLRPGPRRGLLRRAGGRTGTPRRPCTSRARGARRTRPAAQRGARVRPARRPCDPDAVGIATPPPRSRSPRTGWSASRPTASRPP